MLCLFSHHSARCSTIPIICSLREQADIFQMQKFPSALGSISYAPRSCVVQVSKTFFDKFRKREFTALLAITSISFAVRCWEIGSAPFWINEADNSRILLYDTHRDRIAWYSSSVGFYLSDILFTHLILSILPYDFVHNGEAGLRIPYAFACSISIPLVYNLANRFCDNKMSGLVYCAEL